MFISKDVLQMTARGMVVTTASGHESLLVIVILGLRSEQNLGMEGLHAPFLTLHELRHKPYLLTIGHCSSL